MQRAKCRAFLCASRLGGGWPRHAPLNRALRTNLRTKIGMPVRVAHSVGALTEGLAIGQLMRTIHSPSSLAGKLSH